MYPIDLLINLRKPVFPVKNKKGKKMPFRMNRAQRYLNNIVLRQLEEGRKIRINTIKARQLGITAYHMRLFLSACLSNPDTSAYSIAHKLDSLKSIFRRHLKDTYHDTKPEFKLLHPIDVSNETMMRFKGVQSMNSTISLGLSARSDTVDLLHVSEAAFIALEEGRWEEVIQGSLPAAEQGHIFFESTARGLGSFHDFTMMDNPYETVFLPWTLADDYAFDRPPDSMEKALKDYANYANEFKLCLDPIKEYNISPVQFQWYLMQVKTFLDRVKEEFPFTLDEAFQASTRTAFSAETIVWLKNNASPHYRDITNVRVWERYIEGHRYVVAIDPSDSGADKSAICVYDTTTNTQVAEIIGNLDAIQCGVIGVNLAIEYGMAIIAPERNGIGLATVIQVESLGYPDELIFRMVEKDPTDGRTFKAQEKGWLTSKFTRPVMIHELRQMVADQSIQINSLKTIDQMRTFVRKDKNGRSRYEHEVGKHDDGLFALMIAVQVSKYLYLYK